jgi:hypothetical protein
LYGNNLQNSTVSVRQNSGYAIAKDYSFYKYGLSTNGTGYNLTEKGIRRDFVILPAAEWQAVNLVEVKVTGTGTLSYVFAGVGASWGEEVEDEW